MIVYHKVDCPEFQERYEIRQEEIKEQKRQARMAVAEYLSERKTAALRKKRNRGAVQ